MPQSNQLTPAERERAVRMVAAGASLNQVARTVGTTRDNIRYHCRKAGVSTSHCRRVRLITMGERTQSLRAWSREYGIPERTLRWRLRAGDRDQCLLRPVRPCKRPQVYDLGLPMGEWHRVLEYADQVGCTKRAAKNLGLPLGAVTAAQRGEWERLG